MSDKLLPSNEAIVKPKYFTHPAFQWVGVLVNVISMTGFIKSVFDNGWWAFSTLVSLSAVIITLVYLGYLGWVKLFARESSQFLSVTETPFVLETTEKSGKIIENNKQEYLPVKQDKNKRLQESVAEKVKPADNKPLTGFPLALSNKLKEIHSSLDVNDKKQLRYIDGISFVGWLKLTDNQFFQSEKRTKFYPVVASFENIGLGCDNVQAQISYFGDMGKPVEDVPNRVSCAYWLTDPISARVSLPFLASNHLILGIVEPIT